MTDDSMTNQACPCCSGEPYANCCEPLITFKSRASTPLQLMRSRYSAYAKKKIDYIFITMKGEALKNVDRDATEKWANNTEWLNLEIIDVSPPDKNAGIVEFIATYKEAGLERCMHERSAFICENEKWYYVDEVSSVKKPITKKKKIARNDLCPCGSKKKFKRCCGV